MYGMMCALRADEVAELRVMNDAAFTARVFGGKGPSLMEDHERTLHLEKLWAAVDFVITGATLAERVQAPLDFLRPGGTGDGIGPDLGHGRARLLSAAQVRVIASAVSAVPADAVDARLTSPRLAEVYPFGEAEADDELIAAATRAMGAGASRDPAMTAQALVAKLKPARGARPTAAERADVRDAVEELRAFLAKLVRAGSGALVSIA
jgi:hypothetical protein